MALRIPVNETDHFYGPTNAPVELVEYGDYQCPHCGRAYPIVKDLIQQLGNNLKFVFRNFPLSKIHPHARMAAIAVEAAALQNKFWEMHDIIFENQKRIHPLALIEYASAIGLNIDQLKTDMEDNKLAEKVDDDFYSGMRSGVNATPTFFINGEKYTGSWEHDDLLKYIRRSYAIS
jgi:protein-disulfide isomerase